MISVLSRLSILRICQSSRDTRRTSVRHYVSDRAEGNIVSWCYEAVDSRNLTKLERYDIEGIVSVSPTGDTSSLSLEEVSLRRISM